MADDLNAPLGQPGKTPRPSGWLAFVPKAVAAALAFLLAGFLIWTAIADDPLGGEPMALAVLAPAKPPTTKGPQAASAPGGTAFRHDGEKQPAGPAPGTQTVTIIDGTSGKRQDVVIPAGSAGAPAEAKNSADAQINPRLLEKSRHGMVPTIGADGTRPAEAYARPLMLAPAQAQEPHIAIIVGRLGISAKATAEALAKLPAPVTFALAPYSADLSHLAAQAKSAGHELLLQVPMEPFDYPDNDPGPQTLLTSLDAEQNADRLHWLMSRFQGYVGITNYMGARFTASEPALAPVVQEAAKRGLIYVDEDGSPRSVASQIAGANNLPFAKADVVIDAVPNPAEIDRALGRLEALARQNGFAIGVASDLPVGIDRIARWSKTVEGRGFVLVPISMVASKAKSS
ncbi:MAG TPA: divergent polysaccharide deacetylase family protein [Xanthobacteraceae bacterium]|nr:divergent polysaccharide deacetylase family protein [Xanthobacteraceae bacterium]